MGVVRISDPLLSIWELGTALGILDFERAALTIRFPIVRD
jgi:hypothetical protein